MSEQCEFLEKCGFFVNYQWNTEVIKQGWISMYCEDREKSHRCERRRIRLESGQPPAANMSPTGTLLPME
jgi:hypothetical protein